MDTQHCLMCASLNIACETQVYQMIVLTLFLFLHLFPSDEVDIIPCLHCQEEQNNEREDAIIVVNHKLGIKSWCIAPLFLYAYKKLMRNHKGGKKNCNLSGTVHYFPLRLKSLAKKRNPYLFG